MGRNSKRRASASPSGLTVGEQSLPDKENREEAGQLEGGRLDLDKFGFSLEDGNRYLDGTCPLDFPPADPDFDMRNEVLATSKTGLEFSARYVLLRGRKSGELYSKPTLFLIKECEGKHEIFSLADDHCFALQYFTESVGKQIMRLLWGKSKRI